MTQGANRPGGVLGPRALNRALLTGGSDVRFNVLVQRSPAVELAFRGRIEDGTSTVELVRAAKLVGCSTVAVEGLGESARLSYF